MLCIVKFTVLIWGTFGHYTVIESDTLCQIFNKVDLICFLVLPVNKEDTMCELIKCVDLGYISPLYSD